MPKRRTLKPNLPEHVLTGYTTSVTVSDALAGLDQVLECTKAAVIASEAVGVVIEDVELGEWRAEIHRTQMQLQCLETAHLKLGKGLVKKGFEPVVTAQYAEYGVTRSGC